MLPGILDIDELRRLRIDLANAEMLAGVLVRLNPLDIVIPSALARTRKKGGAA